LVFWPRIGSGQPSTGRAKSSHPSSWLSPEQALQYDSQKHFEVIGSDTGMRYRIRHGNVMNIDQLDAAGNTAFGWCFIPEGELAMGDCMLAQKIALETFEAKALAIANQRPA
jgi:hypothetical protein